ncbi:hypothetical protein CRG98_011512 [Punica granatum]|uniref:Peptidase A1 domain-containing protein n=1 Tax=Punica granatum TaxID=22663 RepID=A0A2I0KJF2_PUNGR|nr:hypothetical protein CRG98_011512 [Punica granatum]
MGQALVVFIFLSILSSFPMATNGLTIKLMRRDQVDLNLVPENLSIAEKHKYMLTLHILELSVSASRRTYLLFDTGSPFTWVQCHGCLNCFKIRGGPFDPRRSTTYRTLPFDSPLCQKQLRIRDSCGFRISYPTSSVEGITSLENVLFTTTAGPPMTVPNLVLGCATSAPGVTFGNNDGPHNPISGIFGIAMGLFRDSFMVITQYITKWKFSYCLPSWNAGHIQSNLLFGDDVKPLPRSAQTTPLQTVQYYLNCYDISVAGKRLNLDRALFRVRPDGTGGFIMDTGTAPTCLVAPAYDKVKEAIVLSLGRHMRPGTPVRPYDLCYSWPLPRIPQLPSLTFHFQNADLEIDFWNVFQTVQVSRGRKSVCMIMHRADIRAPNLLGAVQQANYRFVHNLRDQTLSFYPETCRGN